VKTSSATGLAPALAALDAALKEIVDQVMPIAAARAPASASVDDVAEALDPELARRLLEAVELGDMAAVENELAALADTSALRHRLSEMAASFEIEGLEKAIERAKSAGD